MISENLQVKVAEREPISPSKNTRLDGVFELLESLPFPFRPLNPFEEGGDGPGPENRISGRFVDLGNRRVLKPGMFKLDVEYAIGVLREVISLLELSHNPKNDEFGEDRNLAEESISEGVGAQSGIEKMLSLGLSSFRDSVARHARFRTKISQKFKLIHSDLKDYIKSVETKKSQKDCRNLVKESLNQLSNLVINFERDPLTIPILKHMHEINKKLSSKLNSFISEIEQFRAQRNSDLGHRAPLVQQATKSTLTYIKKPEYFSQKTQTMRFSDIKLLKCKVSTKNLSSFFEVGFRSSLAMKSSSSYLAVQKDKGISLIEEGSEIFSKSFLKCSFRDVVFLGNKYYIYEDNTPGIYSKTIDKKDPTLWLKIKANTKGVNEGIGRHLRATQTPTHKLIVINIDGSELRAILIDPIKGTPSTSISIKKTAGTAVCSHEILNPPKTALQDSSKTEASRVIKLISLTQDGYLFLNKLDLSTQRCLKTVQKEIQMDRRFSESCAGLAVCPHSRFIAVETYNSSSSGSQNGSKIIIFEICEEGIVKKKSLDINLHGMRYCYAMSFYLHSEDHILLAGVSWISPTNLVTYDYDIRLNELREIIELRKEIQGTNVGYKMIAVDGELFCSDFNGNMIKIQYYE